MNENLKGLIEEMVDIYGHFEDLRYRNGNFTREALRYVAEMAMIHPPKPSYSVKPKSIDFTGFDDFYLPQKQSRE